MLSKPPMVPEKVSVYVTSRVYFYGVTNWLIVISSKSDKFFERRLPWSAFRSVHLQSVKSRLFFTLTSLRTVTHRDDTNYPQALDISGHSGRFGLFLLGIFTRRKDIKKPHAVTFRHSTRLLVLLCFLGCQTLNKFVNFRHNEFVS